MVGPRGLSHAASESRSRTLEIVTEALTVELDDRTLAVVRKLAVDDGISQSQVVINALQRYLSLRGLAVLNQIAARQETPLSDEEAMALATSELRAMREERRQARSA